MKKVLIVEDNKELQELMHGPLLAANFEVAFADSGEEGISMYKLGNFDIVVADVNIGALCGLSLLREIRRIDSEAIVIVMSGSISDYKDAAYKAGAFHYMYKPFSISALLQSLVSSIHYKKALVVA